MKSSGDQSRELSYPRASVRYLSTAGLFMRALIFFHGLGLSHMDIEINRADGVANHDWALEEGMVVPLHLLYPGGENERLWLEEVATITPDGGRPLFSWGFDPICGN